MTINILLCDTFPGLLPPYIPSYASMFEKLFRAVDSSAGFRIYRTMDGELPIIGGDSPKAGELYLITGCNKGAYDKDPWIGQLLGWIREADRAQVKLTGICFGHQAIAQALGGRVEKAAEGWGCGIRESMVVDGAMDEYFPEHKMRLLYNHHDQVTVLPQGAKLCATSGFCPVESFRIGGHILTFQGHPEYISEYSEHLIRNFADDEPASVKEAALASLSAFEHQGCAVARLLLDWAAL